MNKWLLILIVIAVVAAGGYYLLQYTPNGQTGNTATTTDEMAQQELEYPWLGVRYEMITPGSQEVFGLSVDHGALIRAGDDRAPSILPNSPAKEVGLQDGDIILAVNGEPVNTENPLVNLLLEETSRRPIELRVLRNGSEFNVSVQLAENPFVENS